jgi:hypothetical protein
MQKVEPFVTTRHMSSIKIRWQRRACLAHLRQLGSLLGMGLTLFHGQLFQRPLSRASCGELGGGKARVRRREWRAGQRAVDTRIQW